MRLERGCHPVRRVGGPGEVREVPPERAVHWRGPLVEVCKVDLVDERHLHGQVQRGHADGARGERVVVARGPDKVGRRPGAGHALREEASAVRVLDDAGRVRKDVLGREQAPARALLWGGGGRSGWGRLLGGAHPGADPLLDALESLLPPLARGLLRAQIAEQGLVHVRVDGPDPGQVLQLVGDRDAQGAHGLHPGVVHERRDEDARAAQEGQADAGAHGRVDQVVHGQEEGLVPREGRREVVSREDAPAHVPPEPAGVQDVGLEQAERWGARLVREGQRAARGGRGVPARGAEERVQGLGVGQLVFALVGVVHGRGWVGRHLLLGQQAAPASRREAQALGHDHAGALARHEDVAAHAGGDLGARQHDQVVHVEGPRVVVAPVVEVPAQARGVHLGARPGAVVAQVVGRGAGEHARAASGHAGGREGAYEAGGAGAVGARDRPVAHGADRGPQLALGPVADTLPVGGARGVRDPQGGAGALELQAVAPVLVDARHDGVRARRAQDELGRARGRAARAGGGAGEHGVLPQGRRRVGPAHGRLDGGRALARGRVPAEAQVHAREDLAVLVGLLEQPEGRARLLRHGGQDELLEVVHHVGYIAQVKEREVFRVELAQPLLLDQGNDALYEVEAEERPAHEGAGLGDGAERPANRSKHPGDEAFLGGAAADLLRVGGVGDAVDDDLHAVHDDLVLLALAGLRVELGEHVLEIATRRVLGDEGGGQDPLEDLVHEVLQDVEPRPGDAEELPDTGQELHRVLLDVVAPDVEEPVHGRVQAPAGLVQEGHDALPHLARVEQGVDQEVAHRVERLPGLGPDVGPVPAYLGARGGAIARGQQLQGSEAHADDGGRQQHHVHDHDAHRPEHADEDVDPVGGARALVCARELRQRGVCAGVVRAGAGVDPAVERLDRVVHPRVVAGLVARGVVDEGAGHALGVAAGDAVGLRDELARLGDGLAHPVGRVVDGAEGGAGHGIPTARPVQDARAVALHHARAQRRLAALPVGARHRALAALAGPEGAGRRAVHPGLARPQRRVLPRETRVPGGGQGPVGQEEQVGRVQIVAHERLPPPRRLVPSGALARGVRGAQGLAQVRREQALGARPVQAAEAALRGDGPALLGPERGGSRALGARDPARRPACQHLGQRQPGPAGQCECGGRRVAHQEDRRVEDGVHHASRERGQGGQVLQRGEAPCLARAVPHGVFAAVFQAGRGLELVLEGAEPVEDVALAVGRARGGAPLARHRRLVSQRGVHLRPVELHPARAGRLLVVDRVEDDAGDLPQRASEAAHRGVEGAGVRALDGHQALHLGDVLHNGAGAEPVGGAVLAQELACRVREHRRVRQDAPVDAVEHVLCALGRGEAGGEAWVAARVKRPPLEGAAGRQVPDQVPGLVQALHGAVLRGHGGLQGRHPLADVHARGRVVEQARRVVDPQGQALDVHGADQVGLVAARHAHSDPVAPDVVLVHPQEAVRGVCARPQRVGACVHARLEVRRDGPLAVGVQVGGHGVLLAGRVFRVDEHVDGRFGRRRDRQAVEAPEQALVVHAPVVVLLHLVEAQVVLAEAARVVCPGNPHLLDQAAVLVLAGVRGALVVRLAVGIALQTVGVDVLPRALARAGEVDVAGLVRIEVAQQPRVERAEALARPRLLPADVLGGVALAHGLVVEEAIHVPLAEGAVGVGVVEHEAPGQHAAVHGPLELRARRDGHPAVVLVVEVRVLFEALVVRVVAGGEPDRLLLVHGDLAHDGALGVRLDVALVVQDAREVDGLEGPRAHIEPRKGAWHHDGRIDRGGLAVPDEQGSVDLLHDGCLAPRVRLGAGPAAYDRVGHVPAVEAAVAPVVGRDARAVRLPAGAQQVDARAHGPVLGRPTGGGPVLGEPRKRGVVRRQKHARSRHRLVHLGRPVLGRHPRDQAGVEGARHRVVRWRRLVPEPECPCGLRGDDLQRLDLQRRQHGIDGCRDEGRRAGAVLLLQVDRVVVGQRLDPRIPVDARQLESIQQLLVPVEAARLRVVPVPDDGALLGGVTQVVVRIAVRAHAPHDVLGAPRVAQVGRAREHGSGQVGPDAREGPLGDGQMLRGVGRDVP